MFLKFKPFIDSPVFKFKDPDTGRDFSAPNREALLQMVRGYRSQNNLETLDYLPQVVDNYLCSLPVNQGACEPMNTLKRGVIQTIEGGIALLKNLLYRDYASQEVADERSAICKDCPHNVFPNKGHFVKWADDMAQMSVGERRSKYHDELGSCEICTCLMRGKVFFKGKLKVRKEELEKFPDFCWQKKEIMNYGIR